MNCESIVGKNLDKYNKDYKITQLINEHKKKCKKCAEIVANYLALSKYFENPVEDIFFKETLEVSLELIELSRIAQEKLRIQSTISEKSQGNASLAGDCLPKIAEEKLCEKLKNNEENLTEAIAIARATQMIYRERIKYCINKSGFTPSDVAKRLGISTEDLSLITLGKIEITEPFIRKFAIHFAFVFDDFLLKPDLSIVELQKIYIEDKLNFKGKKKNVALEETWSTVK